MKSVLLLALISLPTLAHAGKSGGPPARVPAVWVRSTLQLPLQVKSFNAQSALSRDFAISAQLESALGKKLDAAGLLGRRLTFGVVFEGGEQRIFDGYVLKAWSGSSGVHVEVGPGLALLRKSADLAPFHRLSYPQVVKKVLARHRFMRARFALKAKYPRRPFTLQYRETDHNFIDRLLEQVGIYYFFEHDARGSRMVLVDHHGAHRFFGKRVRYVFGGKPQQKERELIQWRESFKLTPGRYTLVDHDQRKKRPKRLLSSYLDKRLRHAFAKLEIYDFPGEYETAKEGRRLARLRAEELTCQRARVNSAAKNQPIVTGHLIEVSVKGKKPRRYLVTSDNLSWSAGMNIKPRVNFAVIPYSLQYRPQRRTAKPMIQGLQIATVVGKADGQGRVRLRFRWARRKGQLSGWVRSTLDAAPAAGRQVVVSFGEGDPDRPLIVGVLPR